MMDERSLGQLLDRHAASLALYARQWCAAPEDIVQEAFVKLITHKAPPAAVVPWLYGVVRNLARNSARAAQRRRRHEAEAGRTEWFVPALDAAIDATTVAAALETLPPEPREVIIMHLWGGLTFTEIAGVLDCSASSAHRWYQAGLQQLRERIESCPNRTRHPPMT
jgi:RNA polymerase sigma factor (sigma-70 family)